MKLMVNLVLSEIPCGVNMYCILLILSDLFLKFLIFTNPLSLRAFKQ